MDAAGEAPKDKVKSAKDGMITAQSSPNPQPR
jgi:hypothetical protein